jgi:hypothetical protein
MISICWTFGGGRISRTWMGVGVYMLMDDLQVGITISNGNYLICFCWFLMM